MTFESLSSRISSLPLVIAGPILRRTEKDSVTVWLALKQMVSNLTLKIYDGDTVVMAGTATYPATLGTNLHIIVVTAIPVSANTPLASGKIYHYDINFDPTTGNTLGSPGILNAPGSVSGGIDKICFGSEILPSFALPPVDINNLKIVHGSCRKPHGLGMDAMAGIYKAIAGEAPNLADFLDPIKRPHHLLLTGDQIYADDVADSLLYMLDDASKALLNWVEELPEVSDSNEGISNNLTAPLKPGNREPLTIASELSTYGVGKSHLMRLGEYYAMYLFAWSDELWPRSPQSFPTFQDLFPGEPSIKPEAINKGGTVIQVITTKAKGFNEETNNIINYQSTLPYVRKVLANVPSYMMCDDHEITDDWFLDLEWTQRVLGDLDPDSPVPGSPLGRRIIQNGLSAFMLFQAWGNNPEYFKNSSLFFDIASGITGLTNIETRTPSNWDNIGNLILPSLFKENNTNNKVLRGGLDYSFEVTFPKHQLIALDSRNRRSFPKLQIDGTALLSNEAIAHQITNRHGGSARSTNLELTILLSPAPIIGHALLEGLIQPTLYWAGEVLTTIPPYSWLVKERGNLVSDKEAWSFNEPTFENILKELAAFKSILILSGDVHYAFSAGVEYWDGRNTTGLSDRTNENRAAIGQLISSSFKNETSMTINVAQNSLSPELFENDFPQNTIHEFIGTDLNLDGEAEVNISIQDDFETNPKLAKIKIYGKPISPYAIKLKEDMKSVSTAQWSHNTKWQYRIKYKIDDRLESQRKTSLSGDLYDAYLSSDSDIAQMMMTLLHRRRAKWETKRSIVGTNNLGVISFIWNESERKAIHNLWTTPRKSLDPFASLGPYTQHTISLKAPDLADPRPRD